MEWTGPRSQPLGAARARARRAAAVPAAILALALATGMAPGAVAEEPAGEGAPPVDLDTLFRLPSDTDPLRQPAAGGVTKERWEARFAEARDGLREAERALAAAQAELEEIASDSEAWQMAAPGAQPTAENSPLSYRLRQEIRRRREAVERAERQLRELETEASLAGVPPEWRRPPRHEDATPAP